MHVRNNTQKWYEADESHDWYNLPTRESGERERVASGGGLDYFENESVITPVRLGELDLNPIRAALAETFFGKLDHGARMELQSAFVTRVVFADKEHQFLVFDDL